jgi:uncharacterized membrane protein
MHRRLPVLIRSAMYALRGGFLVRPFVIAILLGVAGAILSATEETIPTMGIWIPEILFPSRQDPQVAQAILSAIATSIMTVVSIVFAILLMTLTLASTQFSPRILVSFVRDRGTQWTLGVFLGTFSYCMAALPAARSLPHAFVPVVSVTGAMLLALVCVGWLIFFINHISQSISVNHIVDRIARETGSRSTYPKPFPVISARMRSSSSIADRVTSASLTLVTLSRSHARGACKFGWSAGSAISCLKESRRCEPPRAIVSRRSARPS